jgi:hypothetical protein
MSRSTYWVEQGIQGGASIGWSRGYKVGWSSEHMVGHLLGKAGDIRSNTYWIKQGI